MDKGLGAVTWWGFSPAVDLYEYYQLTGFNHTAKNKNELDVLLVGNGDIRHVLKTITKMKSRIDKHRETIKSIHFYILENNLELYARMLLMLSLALEAPGRLGLQEKTELMAEIFGNALIRAQTASCVQSTSNDFVKMVTDFDLLKEKLPIFDLDCLKYKERDMLEGIFKLWRKPDTNIFDVEQCWDLRVRQYLGTRYDTAKGAFDWDYSMKLCDRGAEIIGSRYYQRWRRTGVAFQLREGSYDVPNKTLASGMIFKMEGERIGRRGYWGDIVVSPYIAFGIECSDDSFFKRSNKEYVSNSEQVSQYNLTSLLHELQTGERYIAPVEDEKPKADQSPAMNVIEEEDEDTPADCGDGGKEKPLAEKEEREYVACDNVKITFLPLNSLPDMATKAKYKSLFDVVYFSNSMVHHLVPPVSDIFADESLLILETAKFITELTREQYIQFTNRIDGMAKSLACETLIDCNPEKDCFAFYKYQKTAAKS